MDIYAPHNATSSSKLPVFFFIQGGGFNLADAHDNGTNLVRASGMNMVVISFTYRVGPYGFLASSEVQKGGGLNNGLKDQRKALAWVKSYISQVKILISEAVLKLITSISLVAIQTTLLLGVLVQAQLL